MNIYCDFDASDFIEYYREKSIVIGKKCYYLSGGLECPIEVLDIDKEGCLVVKEADDSIHTYSDGEIRIRI